jgi:hypothetical protein
MIVHRTRKSLQLQPYRAAKREHDKASGLRRLPRQHGQIFLPGQPVPETGIYEIIHARAHRQAHEVVMHRGDPFPVCEECDARVRFRVIRTAPYIFDDEDFQG